MQRQHILFLPNRPSLMGELRPEFEMTHGAWVETEPCGEPTIDAPDSVARGSTVAIQSCTGVLLTQGHVSRDGWRAKVCQ